MLIYCSVVINYKSLRPNDHTEKNGYDIMQRSKQNIHIFSLDLKKMLLYIYTQKLDKTPTFLQQYEDEIKMEFSESAISSGVKKYLQLNLLRICSYLKKTVKQ